VNVSLEAGYFIDSFDLEGDLEPDFFSHDLPCSTPPVHDMIPSQNRNGEAIHGVIGVDTDAEAAAVEASARVRPRRKRNSERDECEIPMDDVDIFDPVEYDLKYRPAKRRALENVAAAPKTAEASQVVPVENQQPGQPDVIEEENSDSPNHRKKRKRDNAESTPTPKSDPVSATPASVSPSRRPLTGEALRRDLEFYRPRAQGITVARPTRINFNSPPKTVATNAAPPALVPPPKRRRLSETSNNRDPDPMNGSDSVNEGKTQSVNKIV
jgi:hypothetical protein